MFPRLAGPDVRVRMDRQDDITRKMTFHGYLDQEVATDAQVNKLFGGGSYRLQLTQRDPESGRWTIKGTRFFVLPGRYRAPMELPGIDALPAVGTLGTVAAAAAPAVSRAGDDPSPNEVLSNALVSQVLDFMKTTKAGPAPVAAPSIDWSAVLIAAMPALFKLLEARQAPAAAVVNPLVNELSRQIDEMRHQLTQLRNQPGPVAAGMTDTLKALKDLMEVRDLLMPIKGEESEEGGMLGLGSKFLDVLTNLQAGQTAPRLTPGAPAAPGQPRTESVAPTVAAWQIMVRPFANQLVSAAQEGGDPDDIASAILSFLPSRFAETLVDFLKQPNAVGLLMTSIPRLEPHGEWVTGLVESLRRIVAEEMATAEEVEPNAEEVGGE